MLTAPRNLDVPEALLGNRAISDDAVRLWIWMVRLGRASFTAEQLVDLIDWNIKRLHELTWPLGGAGWITFLDNDRYAPSGVPEGYRPDVT